MYYMLNGAARLTAGLLKSTGFVLRRSPCSVSVPSVLGLPPTPTTISRDSARWHRTFPEFASPRLDPYHLVSSYPASAPLLSSRFIWSRRVSRRLASPRRANLSPFYALLLILLLISAASRCCTCIHFSLRLVVSLARHRSSFLPLLPMCALAARTPFSRSEKFSAAGP